MQTDFYFKIGITSSSIIQRLKQVQTGCPTPIRNILYYSYKTKHEAYAAEKTLHNSFKWCNTYGEWFSEFPKYIYISQDILNIKFEKIELDVNKHMINYFKRYLRIVSNASTLIQLENIFNSVTTLNDKYFLDGQKEIIFNKIKRKTFEIDMALKVIEIKNIEKNTSNMTTNHTSYSEITKLAKKLKQLRKNNI